MQLNSGIFTAQTAFPVLDTPITPDDPWKWFLTLEKKGYTPPLCTCSWYHLPPPPQNILSHWWHLPWTKFPARASRNKPGELCQPTEHLTLLCISFQLYFGGTKWFKRKSRITGRALEGAGANAVPNFTPHSHLKGIFSQTNVTSCLSSVCPWRQAQFIMPMHTSGHVWALHICLLKNSFGTDLLNSKSTYT